MWLTVGVSLRQFSAAEGKPALGFSPCLALISGAVSWLFMAPGLRLSICEVKIGWNSPSSLVVTVHGS